MAATLQAAQLVIFCVFTLVVLGYCGSLNVFKLLVEQQGDIWPVKTCWQPFSKVFLRPLGNPPNLKQFAEK